MSGLSEPIPTSIPQEATTNVSTPAADRLMANLSIEERTKIQSKADALESQYQEEHGEEIAGSLNGSPTEATRAHSFLFDQTIGETDPEAREDANLAHLLLDARYNIRGDRAKTLQGKPLQEDPRTDFYHGGMLPSGQELVKGSTGERLRVSSEQLTEAYSRFCTLFDQYQQIYTGERMSELPEGLTARQLAIVLAAQKVAMEYFGNPNDHSEGQNTQMYANAEEHTLGLEEFKGTTNAVCTEYASLTQQLMAFAGQRSDLISGIVTFCDPDSVTQGSPTGEPLVHAFNLVYSSPNVTDGRVFVFDPSNPIIEADSSDPTIERRRLYLAQLTPAQWEGFRKDLGNTYVQYKGTHRFYSLT